MSVPTIKLNDGHSIPQVGLGTWHNKDSGQYEVVFKSATEAGYRHFDTAQAYDNEQFLGTAWRNSGINREELFITTKIAVQNFGKQKAARTFAESLERLQTEYVDLLLMHFPVPVLRKQTWLALEKIQAAGQAKSIGVSNFTVRHLKEMKSYAKILPAVNQVELHVFLQQPELVQYCRDNNIAVEAYSPLAQAHDTTDEVVQGLTAKHNKSYAQIMLRYLVQQGIIVIPKSVTPSRIRENIDLFDFNLDDETMTALAECDKNMRTCWSPVHVP